MLKYCTACKETKKVEEFCKNRTRSDGYSNMCRQCSRDYNKQYYVKNEKHLKEKFKIYNANNKDKIKNRDLKRKYGLSIADINSKLIEQDFKCLIGGEKIDSRTAKVDHCHKTGKVRGLLCSNCNVALGLLKDSPKALREAIKYLTKRR